MVRMALVVLAAAVAVMLFLLVRAIRNDPEPAPAPGPTPIVAEARGESVAAGDAPSPAPEPIPEPPASDPEPAAEEPAAEAIDTQGLQRRLSLEVPRQMIQAAASCYDERGGKWEKMVVRYRLEFSRGAGSFTDVGVEESDLDDPALERCVLAAIASLRIRQDGMPDMTEESSIDVTIAALRKQSRPVGALADDLLVVDDDDDDDD
jgi:hypothetical protein